METAHVILTAIGTVSVLLLGVGAMIHRQTLLIREDIKAAKQEFKQGLEARMDRSEKDNKAEHAELKEQVKAQGEALTDVRVEVGKLSGITEQALVEALRRLVGKKDSGGPPDSA